MENGNKKWMEINSIYWKKTILKREARIVKRYNGSSNARKIIFFTLLSSLLKKSLKKGILTKVKSDGDAI